METTKYTIQPNETLAYSGYNHTAHIEQNPIKKTYINRMTGKEIKTDQEYEEAFKAYQLKKKITHLKTAIKEEARNTKNKLKIKKRLLLESLENMKANYQGDIKKLDIFLHSESLDQLEIKTTTETKKSTSKDRKTMKIEKYPFNHNEGLYIKNISKQKIKINIVY